MPLTVDGWQHLVEQLAVLQQCQDMMNSSWLGGFLGGGGKIFCGRGCHDCCTLAVNCSLPEAVVLARELDVGQAAAVAGYVERLRPAVAGVSDLKEYLRLQRRQLGSCPLLDGAGCCGAYRQRPLACRALLSTRERRWCGMDFAACPPGEKQGYLDSLDRATVDFPTHYVAVTRETGRELEHRSLALMRERFGFAIYGCLPVLVHLVLAHGLDASVTAGSAAAQRTIAAAGLANPLLVELVP